MDQKFTALFRIPQSYCFICRPSGNPLTIRTECRAPNFAFVPFQNLQFTALRILHPWHHSPADSRSRLHLPTAEASLVLGVVAVKQRSQALGQNKQDGGGQESQPQTHADDFSNGAEGGGGVGVFVVGISGGGNACNS